MCQIFRKNFKYFSKNVKNLQKFAKDWSKFGRESLCERTNSVTIFVSTFWGVYRGFNPDLNPPNILESVSPGAWCSLALVT